MSTKTETFFPLIPVWDIFIRVFHWSLVLAVSVAGLTGFLLGATWLDIHIWAGAAAGALIFARLVWGFLGSAYARFKNFVPGPATLRLHLNELRSGTAPRHIGHNPLGALMILGLIGTILALGLSGAVQLGGEFKTGPLAFLFSYDTARLMADLHGAFANILLTLVILHVAGALYESWRTRENLPKSMLTGQKQSRPGDHVTPQGHALPILASIAILGGLGLSLWGGVTLAARPGFGAAKPPVNAVYADECSACHMAFPPSLMPGENWTQLMQTLPDHFGEDASLGRTTTRELTDWLIANSADTVDTKPARVLARVDPANPIMLTKTPFWLATHDPIDDATFKRAPIYSRSNCAACHSDADSGAFYPGNIDIPAALKPETKTANN
ncbi:MAG: cytochrome B [Alphaproteobacteria bacterium]|nr:cytochrome B [Alphaproteobacteria bacterium]